MRKFLFLAVFAATLFAYENVDAKTFATLAKEKDVVLLDVRTPAEFREGHVQGANLIPIQVFGYLFLGGKGIGDKKILVYCHSGNRSAKAAQWLESWGAKRVYNLRGGILEWQAAKLPLVR